MISYSIVLCGTFICVGRLLPASERADPDPLLAPKVLAYVDKEPDSDSPIALPFPPPLKLPVDVPELISGATWFAFCC